MAATGIGSPSGPSGLSALASGTPVAPGPINPGGEALRVAESCANTFDPTAAPGLDRPIGSFLHRRNGRQAWYKFGEGDTDWTTLPGSGAFGAAAAYSLDELIKMRAASLLGLTQFSYWSDPFLQSPDRPGSPWVNVGGAGVHTNNASPGGVVQLGGGGFKGMIVDPYNAAPYPFEPAGQAPSFVGELADEHPFYMFWRFRLQASELWSPDCSLVLGLVDATTLDVAGVGLGLGTSFFGGVGGDVNGTNHLVQVATPAAQDFAWHSMELLRLLGIWWVKIDDGVWVDFSAVVNPTMQFGTPLAQIMTTLDTSPVLPVVEVDHVGIATIGNAAAMSTTPEPP